MVLKQLKKPTVLGDKMQNKENTPGFVPGLDYDDLNARVNSLLMELFEVQNKFPQGSNTWHHAADCRFRLGHVQDHILRVRGIRATK
jgi:hypothetical protein